MEVISRNDAESLGLLKYFTGKPCPHGHVSERYVCSYGCCECSALRTSQKKDYQKQYREKNKDRLAIASAENYKKNKKKRALHSAENYKKNRDKNIARSKQYYSDNKKSIREKSREYRHRNLDRVKEQKQRYYKDNKAKIIAAAAFRKAQKRAATPRWLSKTDKLVMRSVYEMSFRLSSCLGVKHHVDHIVPIKGDGVCGLHVPWNLRAVPEKINLIKGNKLLLEEPS